MIDYSIPAHIPDVNDLESLQELWPTPTMAHVIGFIVFS